MATGYEQFEVPYQGKRVRLTFPEGEIAEVDVFSVALPSKYDSTPESWGVVYKLLATNRIGYKTLGAHYWDELDEIEKVEVMEEGIA